MTSLLCIRGGILSGKRRTGGELKQSRLKNKVGYPNRSHGEKKEEELSVWAGKGRSALVESRNENKAEAKKLSSGQVM